MFLIFMIISSFIIGCWLSPFPYWPAYFRLWKHVLFDTEKNIHFRVRIRQIRFLLKYILLCPIRAFLWYLDELLFPGYKRQKIQPVFITGLPRSGTTLLHRTMATDKDSFFAVRYFEWSYPYLTIQKLIRFFGFENRFKNMSYWPDTEDGQTTARMHNFTLYDWEEDGFFFQELFLVSDWMLSRFPYPRLLPYFIDFSLFPRRDRRHIINIHQKVVKKIMYLKGADKIYLSKQTSNNMLKSFLCLYPDARFITLLRPVNDVFSSLILLIKLTTQFETGIENPPAIFGWEDIHSKLVRTECLRLINLLQQDIEPEKQYRLTFEKLTKNIAYSVRDIYAWLDLNQSDAYLQYLNQVQQVQQSRQRGYDYEKRRLEGLEEFDVFISKVASGRQLPMLEQN